MNLIIPFSKEIKFNTNIAEITSISLEHDYTVNESELLGNFKISGEYRSHEVSVNKETFEHVLPFSVEITNNIDKESLEFMIDDFTYEIINNDTLKVNIEYKVNAIEVEEQRVEVVEDLVSEKEEIEVLEEEKNDREEVAITDSKEEIIDAVTNNNEEYVTYNIHILRENETVDMVCKMYNVALNVVENYNDLSNISIGDKIVIPEVDE